MYHQPGFTSPLLPSLRNISLPVSTGSPSPGAASAKASKAAITAIATAAISAASVAASSTSHQIAEEKEDEANVAGFGKEEQDQQEDSAADDDLKERKMNRLGLAGWHTAVLVDGGDCEGNTSILSDDIRNPAYPNGNGSVVVILAGGGSHGTANVANLRIIQDAFKAIAHFDAAAARIHDKNHEDAPVFFVAYFPLVFEFGGKLLDALIVVECLHGDDGDLGVSFAVYLGADGLEILFDVRAQDSCKIADVAGGGRK